MESPVEATIYGVCSLSLPSPPLSSGEMISLIISLRARGFVRPERSDLPLSDRPMGCVRLRSSSSECASLHSPLRSSRGR